MNHSTSSAGDVRQDDENALPRYFHLPISSFPVLRLGLATRGNTHLSAADIAYAVSRGVNYLNWCGHDDGMARALREKHVDRQQVVVAAQLESRDGVSAARELAEFLHALGTDRIDFVTFYYVEAESEWQQIIGRGGALEFLQQAQADGQIGIIGLTSHQRRLAASWAQSGKLGLLMIRYNAAHRGAEQDVFPVVAQLGIPVVCFTAQRWGALRERTVEDPPHFTPPAAREWYRFVLAHSSMSVALMAPNNRHELEEDLMLLDDWRPPSPEEFKAMAAHGARVRRCARNFP